MNRNGTQWEIKLERKYNKKGLLSIKNVILSFVMNTEKKYIWIISYLHSKTLMIASENIELHNLQDTNQGVRVYGRILVPF